MQAFKVVLSSTEEFYPTFKSWSKSKNFPVMALDNLGKEIFVCYWFDKIPIYCCTLFHTDSAMALVGFPLANTKVPYILRRRGLPFLFKEMSRILREHGYTKIWTTSGTPAIMEVLEAEDYLNADPNVNVYIKIL